MKCRVCLFALVFGLLSWLICGCSSKANTPEDAKLKKNVYTNKFFGFQVRIPDTWTIVRKPSAHEVRKNAEALLGMNREMGAATMKTARQNRYLLMARNVVEGNSIGIVAHSLEHLPDVESGRDMLDEVLELGAGPGKPLQQVGEVATVRVASRQFDRADVMVTLMGRKQHSAMFVTIEKGYALLIMITAKNEAGVDEVLTRVGLTSNAAESRRVVTVAAREPWFNEIKLQGISGTGDRRLAIINGKTFAAGDTSVIKVKAKTVTLRCVEIGDKTATITLDGAEEKRELKLGVY